MVANPLTVLYAHQGITAMLKVWQLLSYVRLGFIALLELLTLNHALKELMELTLDWLIRMGVPLVIKVIIAVCGILLLHKLSVMKDIIVWEEQVDQSLQIT
jgi:hypothetical protein